MGRDFESTYGLRVDPEPFVWGRSSVVEQRETQEKRASDQDLRSAVDRWNLPTGIAATPTFHELLKHWRPVHAPEIPTTLLVAFSRYEASGWNDATHGTAGNGYTSPPFYELGVFQVPAGLHGRCTDKKCEHGPPGLENARSPSAWSRLCTSLRLDQNNWKDPTTQVRVGLANLENDARIMRSRYPELFPRPGTDWDLRGAVLLPFVGIGTANTLIRTYRQKLSQLPEADRWQYLSSQAIGQQPGAKQAARMRDLLNNVNKKMRLHQSLTAHIARNRSSVPAAPPKGAPTVSTVAPASVPRSPWQSQGVDYVKWLQGALNQVLKVKLSVDGNPGSGTLGAIQRLQRGASSKLARIGLVGSWTNRALIKGGALAPPAFAPPAAVGIDCNFDTRPYLSCLQKATWRGQRVTFVVRYYSGYQPKDLSRDEALALAKLGIRCVTVWEGSARDASGYDNGRIHGQRAFRLALQCGQPTGTPIYFAVDYEPSPAQRPNVARYFEGVRDGLALVQRAPKINPSGASYQIGVYGNRIALDLCKAQGIVTWFWQSCSKLTAGGANQFRWPGVALHQVACEQPLCAGCGSKPCLAKVDWNESDGHEGSWLPPSAARAAQDEFARTTDEEEEVAKPTPLIMLTRLRLA